MTTGGQIAAPLLQFFIFFIFIIFKRPTFESQAMPEAEYRNEGQTFERKKEPLNKRTNDHKPLNEQSVTTTLKQQKGENRNKNKNEFKNYFWLKI